MDGVEKMSKSYGNHIGIMEKAEDMYGKVLSIKDEMIGRWFALAADADDNLLNSVDERLNDSSINPMDVKRELATKIVELFYDPWYCYKAEKHFNNVVVNKGVPDEIPQYFVDSELLLVNIIFDSGLLKSKSEARRMIKQVQLN